MVQKWLGRETVRHNASAATCSTSSRASAIDYSAEKILSSGTAPLIVFATALVVWDLTVGVFGATDALNRA